MSEGIAHGGRLIEARRRYPHAPEPFLDLSTGINPHSYPAPALPAETLTRLPEPEQLEALQRAAADAYRMVDPAMVTAAPGTQILISLLPHLLNLRGAAILGPTYGEHAGAWRACGLAVEEAGTLRDWRAAARHIGGAAILCNPNNPDGRLVSPSELLELARNLAAVGGMLIVDEAFADLQSPDPGLAPHLPCDGLLILRSFGKCYGLAGVRLGFLLANPELAGRVRTALGPWAVSGAAIAIGRMALADASWRQTMRRHLQAGGGRLDRMLADAGGASAGGTALFRLYRSRAAQHLFDHLAAEGILTRRFDHDPDLLRIGLPGADAAWQRLQAALDKLAVL